MKDCTFLLCRGCSRGTIWDCTQTSTTSHHSVILGSTIVRVHNDYFYFNFKSQFIENHFGNKTTASSITVRALNGGFKSLVALVDLVRKAEDSHINRETEQLIDVWDRGNWVAAPVGLLRPMKSVVPPDEGIINNVSADLTEFLTSADWYAKRHIPYTRGYLFHGPPGTGETTLVRALAETTGLRLAVISLATKNLADQSFLEAVQSLPKNCILLLEDVDTVFQTKSKPQVEEYFSSDGLASIVGVSSELTLGGILNALDGISTPSGLIVVMTANHPELLPKALLRPGRVDLKVEVGLATISQAYQLFFNFFEDAELAQLFASNYADRTCSMAALQEHLIRYKKDAALAAITKVESQ